MLFGGKHGAYYCSVLAVYVYINTIKCQSKEITGQSFKRGGGQLHEPFVCLCLFSIIHTRLFISLSPFFCSKPTRLVAGSPKSRVQIRELILISLRESQANKKQKKCLLVVAAAGRRTDATHSPQFFRWLQNSKLIIFFFCYYQALLVSHHTRLSDTPTWGEYTLCACVCLVQPIFSE